MQCLEGYKKNSDILKDEIKILKFKRKRKEIQCLEAWEKIAMFGRTRWNSKDRKDKKGNVMFGRIR